MLKMGNKLGPTCCPSNETILDMIMLQLFRCFPKMWPTGDSKVGYSSALLAPINFTYVFFVVVVVVFHEHIDTTSLIEEFYYFSFSLVLERERNKESLFVQHFKYTLAAKSFQMTRRMQRPSFRHTSAQFDILLNTMGLTLEKKKFVMYLGIRYEYGFFVACERRRVR